MDNQQEKELFELNKDNQGSQSSSSEFTDLENYLHQHHNLKAPSYLKNTIMAKTKMPSPIIQVLLPLAAALFLIFGFSFGSCDCFGEYFLELFGFVN